MDKDYTTNDDNYSPAFLEMMSSMKNSENNSKNTKQLQNSLSFVTDYGEEQVVFVIDKYATDNLYVGLYSWEEEGEYFEPYCNVTVNLPDTELTNENCGFLDINHNSTLVDFLVKNKLGTLTGNAVQSGFCIYPEFSFDLNELNKHVENSSSNDLTEYY